MKRELNGVVNEVSADLSIDEHSGAGFYTVRVSLPRTELKKLKGLTLAPGMLATLVDTIAAGLSDAITLPLFDEPALHLGDHAKSGQDDMLTRTYPMRAKLHDWPNPARRMVRSRAALSSYDQHQSENHQGS